MLNTQQKKKKKSIFRNYKAEPTSGTKNIWTHQASHVLVIAKAGWKNMAMNLSSPFRSFYVWNFPYWKENREKMIQEKKQSQFVFVECCL